MDGTTAAPAGDNGAASTSATMNAGGTTASTATTATTNATNSTVTTNATPSEWYAGADELTQGYVQNKGWKSPLDAINSYQNLEKLFGADKAGNTVVLPKSDAPPEEWGKVFDRLGRPTDANGYKIDIPEGIGDENFAKSAAATFHQLGLTKSQGEALAAWWNQTAQAGVQASQEAKAQQFQADSTALQQEWGAAYTQNLAQAQAAVRMLGIDSKQIDALSDALGHKATMALFQKIGSKAGESDFVTGNGGFGSAMTPAAAKDQIRTLMSDKGFSSKYMSGDADARAKMAELHKYAYPEG